jgi:hypothetical protein
MWFQMKLNPAPPDPTQKMIFDWMPVIFTIMLASFPAGLVIYWAWNNLLSVTQQAVIMHRHGAKIELWDNLKAPMPGKGQAAGGVGGASASPKSPSPLWGGSARSASDACRGEGERRRVVSVVSPLPRTGIHFGNVACKRETSLSNIRQISFRS